MTLLSLQLVIPPRVISTVARSSCDGLPHWPACVCHCTKLTVSRCEKKGKCAFIVSNLIDKCKKARTEDEFQLLMENMHLSCDYHA